MGKKAMSENSRWKSKAGEQSFTFAACPALRHLPFHDSRLPTFAIDH
jgi:hypothetical protein